MIAWRSFLFLCFACAPAAANAFNCEDANRMYDDKAYRAVLVEYTKISDTQSDGCIYNLAGLSAFKADGDNEKQKVMLGIALLKKSAEANYLPGTYNLFKYAYRYTDTDLGVILSGLSALVAEGRADKNRKVSVLSIELGNLIIESCSSSVLAENCRNRRVKQSDKEMFLASTRDTLSSVRSDVDSRSQEIRDRHQAISMAMSFVLIGAGAAAAGGAIKAPVVGSSTPPPPSGLTATEMIKLGILK